MWQGGFREGPRLRSSLAAGIVLGLLLGAHRGPSVLPLSLPHRLGCSQRRDVSKHILLFLIPWCWEGRVGLPLCAEAWLSQLPFRGC